MDTAPITMMNRAITHAKTGRSIKKRAMSEYPGYLAAGAEAAAMAVAGAELAADADAEAAAVDPAAGAPCAGAATGVHGTGVTGAPGTIIFWKPSTTTFSPAFRPSSTTQLLPCWEPILMGRGAGLLSGPTTMTVSPLLPRVTACWGTSMAEGKVACDRRARTYWPGSKALSGLGTSARRVIWPEVGSTVTSENSSLPLRGSSEPSSRMTLTGTPASPLASESRRSFCRSVADWVMFR